MRRIMLKPPLPSSKRTLPIAARLAPIYWDDPVPPWRPGPMTGSASFSTLPRSSSLSHPLPKVNGPSYSPLGPGLPIRKQDPGRLRHMGRPMFAGKYLLEERSNRAPNAIQTDVRNTQLQKLQKVQEEAGRQTEMLFELADTNSDWELTFEEFRNLTASRLAKPKTKEEKKQREVKLREWYAALDANGDGVIDPFEYFTFALRQCLFHVEIEKEDELRSVMKENKASKDQSAFNILVFGDLTDKEGKTFVRRAQFAKLSKRLGFGAEVGETVFDRVLVHYLAFLGQQGVAPTWGAQKAIEATFLLKTVHQQTADLRSFLVEWTAGRKGVGAPASAATAEPVLQPFDQATIDELVALEDDVHGLLRKLRDVLRGDPERAESIFRAMDDNGTYSVSAKEFGKGLRTLGYDAPMILVDKLFDELDDDDSYKLGFSEFKTWLFADDELFEAQLND